MQSASGITKCDRSLLQSASVITKCDRLLLQSVSGITKCDSYYKVRRNTIDCRENITYCVVLNGLSHWLLLVIGPCYPPISKKSQP